MNNFGKNTAFKILSWLLVFIQIQLKPVLSVEINIFINPVINVTSPTSFIFPNLNLGFQFLITQIPQFSHDQFQANFWLLSGNVHVLPMLNDPIDFSVFQNNSGISFNSYSTNNSISDTATIFLNRSYSFLNFSQMSLNFSNLIIHALNPFSLQRSALVFNDVLLYFNLVIINASLTDNGQALFYCENCQIWIVNVTFSELTVKKQSAVFALFNDQNHEIVIKSENLMVSQAVIENGYLFILNLYGMYSGEFKKTIISNLDCSFVCQLIAINKAYYKNETGDNLVFDGLLVKASNFSVKSCFMIIKNIRNPGNICVVRTVFNNTSFFSNHINKSQIFNYYKDDCVYSSSFTNLILQTNYLVSSLFIKLPAFQVFTSKFIQNVFEDSALMYNNVDSNYYLYYSVDLILKNIFLLSNVFSLRALFSFQYCNSTQILNSKFVNNPTETLFYIVGFNFTSIHNCEVLNSLNRYHFSILDSRNISIINSTVQNKNQTKRAFPQSLNVSFHQDGGCITITLFEYLFVQALKFNFLIANNSNLFEITKDNSQESNRNIKYLEIRDCVLTENTLFGILYSVSIFNLMITQSFSSTFFFINNTFINNVLYSLTPNQINNAICFLFMSVNAKVLLESNYVVNKIGTNSIYQTSLLYINTRHSIMKNCSFVGYDDVSVIADSRLNHIKVFAGKIDVWDCKFIKLGSPNGGALFLSAIGSNDSTVFINNSIFINNTADTGGAIFFSEPYFFDVINISFCSFIDNYADYGSVFYFKYERSENDDDYALKFYIISSVFEQDIYSPSCDDAIDFAYQGNFTMMLSNCEFKRVNAKIRFAGDTDYDQNITFEKCKFQDSNMFYKDLFTETTSSLRLSQYLTGIEINQVYQIIFDNNLFDNIVLNISDVNYLDLTSFILIFGSDINISFFNNSFTNFAIVQNFNINSQSYLGIICFISIDDDTLSNNITIKDSIFSNLSIPDLLSDPDSEGINFLGGGIFILDGNLSIENSNFSTLSFIQGSCMAAINSVININNSFFQSNNAINYASIAYIKGGDLNLAQSKLIRNADILRCLGKGNIKIFDNYFEIDDLLVRGLIYFNYENIFVYGCDQPETKIKGGYYYQKFKCEKNVEDFNFTQIIKIRMNKTSKYVKYLKEFDQFFVSNSTRDHQIVLNSDLFSLKIEKLNNSQFTDIRLYRNIFNLSIENMPFDGYVFLIGYYDSISDIYANIKTKRDSVDISQFFIIGVELRQCPLGSLYNMTNQNCTHCSSGTFSVDPLVNSCNVCPTFGNCFEGKLQPKANYWRSNKFSSKMYFCKINPSNCLGGADSACKKGAYGPKCESCDYSSGYVRKLNYECSKCDINMLFDFIFAMIIFLAQIVFLFIYIYSWYNTIELTKESQGNLEETELIKHKKRLNIYVDVLSNYFQIISLIASLKTQKFPNFIYEFLDLTIPTAILDTKYCLFLHMDSKNIVYVDLFYIILLPIFKLFLLLIFWYILKKKCKKIKINKNHFILGLICLYRFEVLGQAYELFSYVSCQNIDGVSYMIKDSQFTCDYGNPNSLFFIYFCSIMLPFIILWIVVFPFLIFFPLANNKKHHTLEQKDILERYGVLYIGYKREFYYWEFFKLLAKILFVFIAKFILFDPGRIILIIIVFCVYAFGLNTFKPYAHHHFNRVEIFASIVYISSFMFFILGEYSLLYGTVDNTYDSDDRMITTYNYMFSSINYAINGVLVLYLLYKMFFAVKQKTIKYYSKAKNYFKKKLAKETKDSNNENFNITENLLPSPTSMKEVEQETMGDKENSNRFDKIEENECTQK